MGDMRIVLLGNAGAGKSSLVNTIFGENVFKVAHALNSETKKCQKQLKSVNGRRITLIDTPGLFNTDQPEEMLRSEIVKCIVECAPGPHAFLIVLKVETFTEHDNKIFDKIQEYFSEEAWKYAVVVFTHGDQLDEEMKVEQFVLHNKHLCDLVSKCGGRCHVVDNKYWKNNQQDEYRNNKYQVTKLLTTIEAMVDKGDYYTSEMLQEVERKIQEEKKRIRESSDLRIVILGKTGAGKSSLGNTIFGENVFKVGHTLNSETNKCQKETKYISVRRITVIDTPGFFDTNQSEEEMRSETVKCIIECAPGPHAFLIVLKVETFTEQEREIVDKIQEYFSEEALKYAVVVFTHGDQLDEEMKIEQFVLHNKHLRNLVSKCGGRCHVLDNKYWKNNQQDEYRNNKSQVEKLLTTIEAMVDKGDYYTNEMLQEVERKIQEEKKRIRESSENMSEEDIRKRAKSNVSNLLKKTAGVTTGALLGAFLGALAGISIVPLLEMAGKDALTKTAEAVGKVVVTSAVTGLCAVVGGCIGYDEADRAASVSEAVGNTAKALKHNSKAVTDTVTTVSDTALIVEKMQHLKNN